MNNIEKMILKAINQILEGDSRSPLLEISGKLNLQKDIGLDSLDLAELTVRIEAQTGVDVFKNRIVITISEIKEEINIEK